jgi:carbon monoxide dehydrogenase subunit G
MSLRFEHSFFVKATPDKVWAYLIDPFRIAPALPGAAITEKVDESTYNGTITVKVGPVSARYRGSVHFEKLNAAARVAEISARGFDVSGRGGADMRMTSRVAERAPGETEVSVVSEVTVTGILAQFGRGLMQDVSNQMLGKFTEAMRAELEKPAAAGTGAPAAAPVPAPPIPAPPIEVVSFGSRIAGRAAARALRRPVLWVLVAVAILMITLLSVR